MEHLPQIADYMGKSLNTEVAALIETLNGAVDNAFADLDRQRAELQGYISAERKALVDQAQQAVDAAVQNAMDRVPALLAKGSSPGSCFSPSSCWACRSASVSGWDGCVNVPKPGKRAAHSGKFVPLRSKSECDMARKKANYPLIEGLEITTLAAEGKAMGRYNDVVVFVPMTVPGDVVDVQIRPSAAGIWKVSSSIM